jgi:2-polyprenyl-6-methoxyphenol hydroxylase-like FAD-dependent oxidoreductase
VTGQPTVVTTADNSMSSEFKIIVIGGGLGGLTFALACLRYGIEIDLYEQAAKFGTVGAGVEIGPNAVQVLNKLGLKKEFEAISSPFSEKYMVVTRLCVVDGRCIDIIERGRRLRLQLMIYIPLDEFIDLSYWTCF